MKVRAVFFDRDGVLNEAVDRGGNFFIREKKVQWTAPFSYDEFRPKPGVIEVLEATRAAGFLTILITNQPDVSYGYLPQKEYEKIMSHVRTWPLNDIFVCNHTREEGCVCKKPKPGMLKAAEEKWNIDLLKSYMIGDTSNDTQAAAAVGVKTILFRTPYNQEVQADHEINSLHDLISLIKGGTLV